jgi:hypothetical protein
MDADARRRSFRLACPRSRQFLAGISNSSWATVPIDEADGDWLATEGSALFGVGAGQVRFHSDASLYCRKNVRSRLRPRPSERPAIDRYGVIRDRSGNFASLRQPGDALPGPTTAIDQALKCSNNRKAFFVASLQSSFGGQLRPQQGAR